MTPAGEIRKWLDEKHYGASVIAEGYRAKAALRIAVDALEPVAKQFTGMSDEVLLEASKSAHREVDREDCANTLRAREALAHMARVLKGES